MFDWIRAMFVPYDQAEKVLDMVYGCFCAGMTDEAIIREVTARGNPRWLVVREVKRQRKWHNKRK